MFITLGEYDYSDKVVVTGVWKDCPTVGVLQVCKYADGENHDYSYVPKEEDVGENLLTLVFMKREQIKKMADALLHLYEIVDESKEEGNSK